MRHGGYRPGHNANNSTVKGHRRCYTTTVLLLKTPLLTNNLWIIEIVFSCVCPCFTSHLKTYLTRPIYKNIGIVTTLTLRRLNFCCNHGKHSAVKLLFKNPH